MKLDISGFKDKDSAKPEYLKLYEELPFIEAYAKHTDMRIAKDGPELAIGAKKDGMQDWDIHGQMQLDFLKGMGMKPEHTLLDIGCGTGRLARKAVPYLGMNNYTGIDISYAAIENCLRLSKAEGWGSQYPVFITGDGSLSRVKLFRFDYIFSHSVITHLPPEVVEQIFADLSKIPFREFIFTYKEKEEVNRSGLKQFQYPVRFFQNVARDYKLFAEPVAFEWPAGQKTMRVWHDNR